MAASSSGSSTQQITRMGFHDTTVTADIRKIAGPSSAYYKALNQQDTYIIERCPIAALFCNQQYAKMNGSLRSYRFISYAIDDFAKHIDEYNLRAVFEHTDIPMFDIAAFCFIMSGGVYARLSTNFYAASIATAGSEHGTGNDSKKQRKIGVTIHRYRRSDLLLPYHRFIASTIAIVEKGDGQLDSVGNLHSMKLHHDGVMSALEGMLNFESNLDIDVIKNLAFPITLSRSYEIGMVAIKKKSGDTRRKPVAIVGGPVALFASSHSVKDAHVHITTSTLQTDANPRRNITLDELDGYNPKAVPKYTPRYLVGVKVPESAIVVHGSGVVVGQPLYGQLTQQLDVPKLTWSAKGPSSSDVTSVAKKQWLEMLDKYKASLSNDRSRDSFQYRHAAVAGTNNARPNKRSVTWYIENAFA